MRLETHISRIFSALLGVMAMIGSAQGEPIHPEGPSTIANDAAELGEAEGLPDIQTTSENLPESPRTDPNVVQTPKKDTPFETLGTLIGGSDWRSYIRIQGQRTVGEFPQKKVLDQGPNYQLSVAGNFTLSEPWQLFLDGTANSVAGTDKRENSGHFQQGGLRFRPRDHFLLVLGKERNRRSPGLILSPSDFLHTAQSVPGLSEEREGVWLVRASWQTPEYSVDAISLPVDRQNIQGMPSQDLGEKGALARGFLRLASGFDLGLDLGRIDQRRRGGAFAQGILAKVWKIYGEIGYAEKRDPSYPTPSSGRTAGNSSSSNAIASSEDAQSQLVGMGYEGWDKFVLRLEWYSKNDAWLNAFPVLNDNQVAIASFQANELYDRFNLSWTALRSLERLSQAHVLRVDWLLTAKQTVGFSWIRLMPSLPFQSQASIDWKFSF